MELSLVERARAFALEVHAGAIRPNRAQQPFSAHIEEVASLVEQSGGLPEEIAAAWLHDTVEDTPTTVEQIEALFGQPVADIVDGLTDKPDIGDLPTLERKTAQAMRVRSESDSVKRVKIADQTSNLRSVAVDPPVQWNEKHCQDYIEGARRIVRVCAGANAFLEAEFWKAYDAAIAAHPL